MTLLAAPSVTQGTRATTLRFAPAANLAVLDPICSSDPVTPSHACYVCRRNRWHGHACSPMRPTPRRSQATTDLTPLPRLVANHQ